MGRQRWIKRIVGALAVLLVAGASVMLQGWGRVPGMPLGANRGVVAAPVSQASRQASGPLRVHPANGRYFMNGDGQAILLAGAHTWYTLVDSGFQAPAEFDYAAYLDSLVRYGHNFFRMFAWEQARWSVHVTGDYFFSPSVYQRPGPGLALDGRPRFDLARFNEAYFTRLRLRVEQANERGIYVAIQLFEGFSVEAKPFMAAQNPWPGHPLNRANNINRIDGDVDRDGQGPEVHTLASPAVTALQEAYVRKVIDTVNDLDNVLFEICNESTANGVAWQRHMISVIKQYEEAMPKQHPVGMTVPWPNGTNDMLFASNADWISPNANDGHFADPPAADGSKVIVNDTDHLCYPCGDTPFVWRTVLRGMNPAFMDPYDCHSDVASDCNPEDPAWVLLRRNLGYARALTERANLACLTPKPEACSTGYCLTCVDGSASEFMAYLPAGRALWPILDRVGLSNRRPAVYWLTDSRVNVDLTGAAGQYAVDWFDPATGRLTTGETTSGGARRDFTAPFAGQAVLHIHPPRGELPGPVRGQRRGP